MVTIKPCHPPPSDLRLPTIEGTYSKKIVMCFYGSSSRTLLNAMGLHNITVECWECASVVWSWVSSATFCASHSYISSAHGTTPFNVECWVMLWEWWQEVYFKDSLNVEIDHINSMQGVSWFGYCWRNG